MRNQRVLRMLIITDIVLTVLLIISELALQSTLPAPLRKWLDDWGEPSLSPIQMLVLALFLVTISVGMIAWIALYNFWKYGPPLYVAAWILSVIGTALSGPSVMTSAGATLELLETVVAGMILGIVYFSDLRARFGAP